MKEFLKKYKFIIIGIISFLIIIIAVIFFFFLKKDTNTISYVLEVQGRSHIQLSFNEKDEIVKVECNSNDCSDIETNKFINKNFDDLENTIIDVFQDQDNIKLRVIRGTKDITKLKDAFLSTTNNNNDDDENVNAEDENKNEEENVQKNEATTSTNNKKPNSSSESTSKKDPNYNITTKPTIDKENFTVFDVTMAWLYSYSAHDIKFTKFSTTPMKYKNPGSDATTFNWFAKGYAQVFDLKSQGITQDDYCVTYTYGDRDGKAMPTTIVPIYNNGKVTYKKYCLGFKVEYDKNYNEITGGTYGDSASVYEWVNNKWKYLGKNGTVRITVDSPIYGPQEYKVAEAYEVATEIIEEEQAKVYREKISKQIDEVEKKMLEVQGLDDLTEYYKLDKELQKLMQQYDMIDYKYDYSILVEK